nr:hypothetical protein B0A51_17603 [Rachicladosporium sp. CCFEE 5018]
MTASIDSLTSMVVPPQTIPEGKPVDHLIEENVEQNASQLTSPVGDFSGGALSRHGSSRSIRTTRASRIPGFGSQSRRSSRRSASQTHSSMSPAHAFLSSWNRDNNVEAPAAEPKPDDEGQSIGLENEYIIGRTINYGGFGVVKEVHTLNTQTGDRIVRAVKIIRKQAAGGDESVSDKAQQDLDHEVSVWRHLKHRHILLLHAVYETDFATFCVMDLNVGGTLFDLVRKARLAASPNDKHKGLPPHLAKRYAYQLACALRYLHEDIRVCHRDVKLENCLIDLTSPNAETEGGNLRLCDFGLADFLHSGSIDEGSTDPAGLAPLNAVDQGGHHRASSSVIGTLEYASPKGLSVNRKLFETAGDVWAYGVIVYALCTGELPFRHSMPSKTVELILHSDWDVNALRLAAAGGGEEVIELVRGCLELDIDLRLTIGDALRSEWFEGCRREEDESETGGDGLWD